MKKLFNFRPLVFAALILAFGIAAAYASVVFGAFWIGAAAFSALSVVLSIAVLAAENNEIRVFAIFAIIVFFIGGASVFFRYSQFKRLSAFERTAEVAGIVSTRGSYYIGNRRVYYATLNGADVDGESVGCVIRAESESEFPEIGSGITFTARLSSTIGSSNFSAYFIQGVALEAKDAREVSLAAIPLSPFEYVGNRIKEVCFEYLGDSAPIAIALLTGNSEYVPKEELENLRFAGVAHVFAVSGLHVGFLAAILNFILNRLNIKRLQKTAIIVLLTAFYSGVCGFTPSSVRAVVMCAVLYFAHSTGNKYDLLNSIAFSMLCVLTINPLDLFSAGFILSYVSITSIAAFAPTLSRALKLEGTKAGNALSVGLSVQYGSVPVLARFFGYVPISSLLVNLIFIPVCSVIYSVLAASAIVAIAVPPLGRILFVSKILLEFVSGVVSRFDFSLTAVRFYFPIPLFIIYYVFAALASDQLNVVKGVKLASFASSCAVAAFCAFGG